VNVDHDAEAPLKSDMAAVIDATTPVSQQRSCAGDRLSSGAAHTSDPPGWSRSASAGWTLPTCSRTCLKERSPGTESPSRLNSGGPQPDSFTHLLTRPRPGETWPLCDPRDVSAEQVCGTWNRTGPSIRHKVAFGSNIKPRSRLWP